MKIATLCSYGRWLCSNRATSEKLLSYTFVVSCKTEHLVAVTWIKCTLYIWDICHQYKPQWPIGDTGWTNERDLLADSDKRSRSPHYTCVSLCWHYTCVSLCWHYTYVYHYADIPMCIIMLTLYLCVSLCWHYTYVYHYADIIPMCIIMLTCI